jgi:5'-3' exonuclease
MTADRFANLDTTVGPTCDACAMAERRPRLVLDSPSLIYRAWFALPPSIHGRDGRPVNAIRGYLDMVAWLLSHHHPRGITHVMDADWRPAWRVKAWPGYKAEREAEPPDLTAQVPVIEQLLAAAGMPVASAKGFEADDVIGTIAAEAGADDRVAVVSGDRDMFQVVRDPAVWVLFPRKGVSELERFDEAAVLGAHGVPPARYADFAILRGDPSDGLPGLPGVGPKTAATLVGQFEDIDALIEGADTLKGKLAAAVKDNAEYLAAMRVVVPVATKVPYELTPTGPPDAELLTELGDRYLAESPVKRLLAALEALDPTG